MQPVWISLCMYCFHLVAWIHWFLCENVAQWCVALSVHDACQKDWSHKTTHMPLTAQMMCVVRMSWDFANTVHTIFHLLSEHNELGYSKNSWTGFLHMCSVTQLLDSRKCNIVLVALMLYSIAKNDQDAVNGEIQSRFWLSLTKL